MFNFDYKLHNYSSKDTTFKCCAYNISSKSLYSSVPITG